MEKQTVEKELNSILNLYKACIDKNYLNELCESRGLLKKAKEIEDARHKLINFEPIFRNVVANYDEDTQRSVLLHFFDLAKIASPTDKARPKNNPTQEQAIKKEEKEKKEIIRKKIELLNKQLEDSEYINKQIKKLESANAKKEVIQELEQLKELSFYEDIKKVKEDIKNSDKEKDSEGYKQLLDSLKNLKEKAKQNILKEKNILKNLDKLESYNLREKIRDLEKQLEDNDYVDNKIKDLEKNKEENSELIKELLKIKEISKFEARAPILKRRKELADIEERLEDEDNEMSEEERDTLKKQVESEKSKLDDLESGIKEVISEQIKILDEQTEMRNNYKRDLGADLNRGFIIFMERRYGDFDEKNKYFISKDGSPLVSIKNGWSDIKDLTGFIINKINIKGGKVDVENIAAQALADLMYSKTKDGKTLFTKIDKLLEEAEKSNELPVEVGPFIIKVLNDKISDIVKKENNNPLAIDKKLQFLEEDIADLVEQEKIEQSQEKLKEIRELLRKKQNFYNSLKMPNVQTHSFVDEVQTQSGDFSTSQEMYENIVEFKEFIEEVEYIIYENDYLNPFIKFLKSKDRLLYEIFSLLIKEKIKNIEDKKELGSIIKKDLAGYFEEYTKRQNFLKKNFIESLIDFSFEPQKIVDFRFDLLKSAKDFLPKTFNLNATLRIRDLLEQGKEITKEDLEEINWKINWGSKRPLARNKKSSILNICEYLDVLIHKLS